MTKTRQHWSLIVALFLFLCSALILVAPKIAGKYHKNNFVSTERQSSINNDGQCLVGQIWCEIDFKCIDVWEKYCGEDDLMWEFEILRHVRNVSGRNFSPPEPGNYVWLSRNSAGLVQIILSGLSMSGNDFVSLDEIDATLIEAGFSPDKNNTMSSSPASENGKHGYINGDMRCVIDYGQMTGPSKNFNVTVFCSEMNIVDLLSPLEVAEIRRVLANSRNFSVEDIEVNVQLQKGEYATGGIMAPPSGPKGDGIFFVRREKKSWYVIYDGDGPIPCNALLAADVPLEMTSICPR
ncbi:MAG: hypothetical protein V1738_05295 [Patescibacteria group bacterium]